MKDVMRILNMKQPQVRDGTLVYSAPLYSKQSKRVCLFVYLDDLVGPNLIYRVVQKPDTADETIRHITQWILANYANQSGIVYCLSKKDTEVVAQSIYKESNKRIRCGAYHADMDEVLEQ
jgi:ATP-dependent DNA helicase Q1